MEPMQVLNTEHGRSRGKVSSVSRTGELTEETLLRAKVAVTGAGGFIGSHLTESLVEAGAEVRALVEYNSDGTLGWLSDLPAAVLDQVEILSGDIRDPETCQRLVEGRDVVFHLAALIAIPYSYLNPTAVFDVNLGGTMKLALASRDEGVGRFIHTSTSEVYGTAQQVPITEDHPIHAQSPYAASKASADQMIMSFRDSYEFPATILRPFNTYGPRQSMRAVLPTIVVQALSGGTIRLGSLDPRRDMTFVSDTVAGFIAAAISDDAEGRTLQLGTGTDHSVGEMVEAVGKAVGRELEVETDPARVRPAASEVERLISDPSRMNECTSWQAETGLDEGISLMTAWIGENLDRFRPDEYAV